MREGGEVCSSSTAREQEVDTKSMTRSRVTLSPSPSAFLHFPSLRHCRSSPYPVKTSATSSRLCPSVPSHNFAWDLSSSTLHSHAFFPKKLKIASSARASAELACPSPARAAMPCAMIARRNSIQARTHLKRQFVGKRDATLAADSICCIGVVHNKALASPVCRVASAFIPSAHHCSSSSR